MKIIRFASIAPQRLGACALALLFPGASVIPSSGLAIALVLTGYAIVGLVAIIAHDYRRRPADRRPDFPSHPTPAPRAPVLLRTLVPLAE